MKTYLTEGIKQLFVTEDGPTVWFEMDTTEGEVAFAMPAQAVTLLLPGLVRVEADAKKLAGVPDAPNEFDIKSIDVIDPNDGSGIVMSLIMSTGVQIGFRVGPKLAERLANVLMQYVEQQKGAAAPAPSET